MSFFVHLRHLREQKSARFLGRYLKTNKNPFLLKDHICRAVLCLGSKKTIGPLFRELESILCRKMCSVTRGFLVSKLPVFFDHYFEILFGEYLESYWEFGSHTYV